MTLPLLFLSNTDLLQKKYENIHESLSMSEFYSENREQETELPEFKYWLVEICNTLLKYVLYSFISSVVYSIKLLLSARYS
jgi:hypothetical protein